MSQKLRHDCGTESSETKYRASGGVSPLPCRRGCFPRAKFHWPRDKLRGDEGRDPVIFAGLRPEGNPLIGFPFAKTSHRDVLAALPDLLVSLGVFRPLRRARKGLCPFHPHQPFEKGWIENLILLMDRWCNTHGLLKSSPRSRVVFLARSSGGPAPYRSH